MVLLALTVVAQEPGDPDADRIAGQTDADRERGEKLFEAHCARCHSVGGTGGEGPALTRPTLRRAADHSALVALIRLGIVGTEMPANSMLSEDEAWQIAGYVRSLGRVEIGPLPGDPSNGRTLYDEQGCEACHILRGQGRGIGPELTDIGIRRGADHLRQALMDPAAVIADDYLMVRVRTADGRTLRGLRLNEDAFTIQLRDADNRLHSFDKAEIQALRKEPGSTVMISYARRLSKRELDDLVAWLASLRGD